MISKAEQDRLGLQPLPAVPLVLDAADLKLLPAIRCLNREPSRLDVGNEADDEGGGDDNLLFIAESRLLHNNSLIPTKYLE